MRRYIIEVMPSILYVYDTEDERIVCQTTDADQAVKVTRALNETVEAKKN